MSVIADIATYLQNNGLGTLGTDIFYSYLPDTADPCIAVYDTGGPQPDTYLPTKEPTFQVFVRAVDYDTGKATLDSIRTLLQQVINRTLIGTYFYFILAISEGGHIGRNERGLDEFSINFHARTR